MGETQTSVERGLVSFTSGEAAFEIPSLEFKPATIYWISGRNGAGKSTLLHHLNDRLSEHATTLLLTQAYDTLVYAYHTVWWNIALPLILRGESVTQAKEVAANLIREFNIPLNLTRKANHLSGGEQKIIVALRAYLSQSQVKLFDEPTASLDASRKTFLWRAIARMCASGTTVIVVSHDTPEFIPGNVDTRLEGVGGSEIRIKELMP